jgi:hypothetical protein
MAAGASVFGGGGASSAWAVAAKPKPVAANAMASRAPARQWRRNSMAVARAVLVVVSWVWLVFVPERAGEAAGVTLTSLVTIAGVGIAVSGNVLEMLQRHGWSMGNGIKCILAAIAALLLPAGLTVLRSARSTVSAPGELD